MSHASPDCFRLVDAIYPELTPSLLRRVERGARGHEGVGTQRSLPPEHVDVPLST